MTTVVSVAQGGTGSNNAAAARSSLGAAPSAAYDAANNAYAAANTASSTGGGGYAQANAAYAQANAAYNNSNTRLSTSGGSISGDLAITGNLTVQGNATTINVSNLSVNDSIILLSTNAVGDSNDIGFIGHFDRGPTATHAGLIRKATQNQFYLFDNYEVEPTNNVIDVAGNNFTVGNLRLGIINANSFVTSAGLDVTGQANAAYGQANAAYSAANNRMLKSGDTMTGELVISAATPSIRFTDTDNGADAYVQGTDGNLRLFADDNSEAASSFIGLYIDGSERFRVANTGSVGIGTATPVRKLHVEGNTAVGTTGTEDILLLGRALSGGVSFEQAASLKLGRYQNAGGLYEAYTRLDFALRDNGTSPDYNTNKTVLTLSNDGNIGIGTVSPIRSSLDGALTIFKLHGSDAAINVPTLTGQSYNNNQSNLYLFGRNAGITVVSKFGEGGHLIFADDDSIRRGAIEYSHTTDHMALVTAASECMRLTSTGNVSIGTTTADTRLRIVTNSLIQGLRITSSNDWGSIVTPMVDFDGNANGGGDGNILRLRTGAARTDVEIFEVVNGNGTQFLIRGDGNVGIGSTSPAVKLDVAGSMRLSATGYLGFGGGTNYIEGDNSSNYVKIAANNAEKFRIDANGSRAFEPLRSLTDSGTKQYTHLCTGSFYSGTGLTVIETNIPAHDAAGNANMFSIKLMGFCYAAGEDGIIDMSIGCYAGEGGYYNASYCATNMPNDWVDKVYFAKNNSTGKVAIILGDTSTYRNYELAVTNLIQGFVNVDEVYAKGWSMSTPASTSGYSNITSCIPTNKSPKTGFHARRTTGYTLSAATIITYDSELYDKNSCYNNSNGRFTAPHKGQYYFRAHAQPTTTGVRVSVKFKKNGSAVAYNDISDFNVYSRQDIHNAVLLELDTNDYVEVEVDVSSSCSFDNHGTFMGVLIG